MTATWAYIFEHPGTDPDADRTVIESNGQRTLLVPISSISSAPEVALRLATSDGVTLIELCGGFGIVDAARVAAAVPDEVAVGHVTFAADSLTAAYAYSASATEDGLTDQTNSA